MTGSVDSLHPDEIESRVWEYVPRFEGRPTLCRFTDYEALFARWEEAERKAEARAEVGYAVEANALREQIRQQREEFDRIVARERDAREKAETERDSARDELDHTKAERNEYRANWDFVIEKRDALEARLVAVESQARELAAAGVSLRLLAVHDEACSSGPAGDEGACDCAFSRFADALARFGDTQKQEGQNNE